MQDIHFMADTRNGEKNAANSFITKPVGGFLLLKNSVMLHLVIHSQIKKMKSENETLFCFNNAKINKIPKTCNRLIAPNGSNVPDDGLCGRN